MNIVKELTFTFMLNAGSNRLNVILFVLYSDETCTHWRAHD